MIRKGHLVVIATGCIGAAACDGNPLDPLPTAFDNRVADGVALLDEVSDLGGATPADAALSGEATYNGFAGFMLAPLAAVGEADFKADPAAYADYVADVTLEVDLDGGVTEGEFRNFFDRNGALSGSLTVSPVGLAPLDGDLVFSTTASGQIDGDPTTVTVEAYFVGAGAEGVLGRGEGDMGGETISHYFVGVAD